MGNEKLSPKKKLLEEKKLSNTEELSSLSEELHSKAYMKDKERRAIVTDMLENAPQTDSIRFHAQVKSPESKNMIDLPIKASVGAGKEAKELDPSKTAVWALVGLGQLTPDEVEEFIREQGNKLTYNEVLSIQLMKDTLKGDPKARQIYWGVQEKIASRKAVMAQIEVKTVKPDSTMSKLLDQIVENMTTEGEVVQPDQDVA